MESFESQIGSLRAITLQLRVPELKYSQNSSFNLQKLKSLFGALDVASNNGAEHGLLDLLTAYEVNCQTPALLNAAFVCDRIFDVWIRKSTLETELIAFLDQWRSPFYFIVLANLGIDGGDAQSFDKTSLIKFIQFFDQLIPNFLGWSPHPERSKKQAIELLEGITGELLLSSQKGNDSLDTVNSMLSQYVEKKDANFEKVLSRLKDTESKKIWNQYRYWYAQGFVDSVFEGHKLPDSLQQFVDTVWVSVLSEQLYINEISQAQLPEDLIELTQALKEVYCVQSERLFEMADSLLDRLKSVVETTNIACNSESWEALERSLVSLLKQEFSEFFNLYAAMPLGGNTQNQFGKFSLHPERKSSESPAEGIYKIGSWYYLCEKQDKRLPMQLVESFKYADLYLFVNHVGMKVDVFSKLELSQQIQSGKIKALQNGDSFEKTCTTVTKGLKRVSDTQQKSRLEAAEKAKQEAERLLEQQRQAEEDAKRKAEEIAQRTKDILKKREDKKRAEQEGAALSLVQKLAVGAWTKIIDDRGEDRYKLVVKIAASKKYIFVDKLGIKKKEFIEDELVKQVMESKVTCLSDGSDFEDSLQRVVSRIRVST